MMTVYIIQNEMNNKAYVGACTVPLRQRWTSHISTARKQRGTNTLHAHMRKYGFGKFFCTEVCSAANKEELKQLERYFVKYFRTLEPNGYNRTEGGDSISETARECLDRTGAEPWNKGLHGALSPETIEKMRESRLGRKLSAETRAKMHESQQRRRADPADRAKTGAGVRRFVEENPEERERRRQIVTTWPRRSDGTFEPHA
jgi:group I intron endonuclease